MAGEWEITPATRADAGEILTLQRACWVQEAIANDDLRIPTLHETLADVQAGLGEWDTYVVRQAGRLIGSVRGRTVSPDGGVDGGVDAADAEWEIGRLMVAPDLQGGGLGRALLEHIQAVAPAGVRRMWLFTGAASERNHRLYARAGFRLRRDRPGPGPTAVVFAKTVR
ncbi:MAG: GNAT family N-acetyltransferase [Nocardioides sp.]|uniref:GNAT family N-acetyltransferase n=1 Tax=Nocardioides sp. TaxID=35761 RepID=UPI0039E2DB24